jgi:hypothetical protein
VDAAMSATWRSGEDVGPLAEEAARLLDAIGEWGSRHQVGGAAECAACPLCQGLALLRQARPETFQHLLDASAALTAAVRSLVDATPPRPAPGVERIRLDDEAR